MQEEEDNLFHQKLKIFLVQMLEASALSFLVYLVSLESSVEVLVDFLSKLDLVAFSSLAVS
jgi:hypothetical protein